MDWEQYSFVIRAKNRKLVLLALTEPLTPTQIRAKTKLNLTHVSRALRELNGEGLVECVTPKARVGKIYRATKQGKEIQQKLNG